MNYIERARRLARSVAVGGATDLTIAIFRAYIVAAGATVRGAWIYIPGRATPFKGFRPAAGYVTSLTDTAPFLRNLANALDLVDREVDGPPAEAGTPLAALAGDLAQRVAELASQLAALGATPPPAPVEPEAIHVPAGVELPELLAADDRLLDRIVRRAQYDALREMLSTLDGWIEGARENHEAMGRRDAFDDSFAPDDIRRMVNCAARAVGTREPYRPPSS